MSYTGPGDLKTYRVWAGLRAYSASYAASSGPCCDIYVSGVLRGTVNILPSGGMDTATAALLIGGGTGKIGKLYDQSGNNNHFVEATDSARPILVLNAAGLGQGQPCISFPTNQELLDTVNNLPSTSQPWGMAMFSQRTGGLNLVCDVMQTAGAGNIFFGYGATPVVSLQADTMVTASAPDNTWHSLVGVANGASSILGVDGASTTGLNAGTDAPANSDPLHINSNVHFIGFVTQFGYAEGGFSTSDITALSLNDQYWFGAIGGYVSGIPGRAHPIIYYNDWQ